MGLQKVSIERIIQKIFDEGIPSNRLKGRVKKYVSYLYSRSETKSQILLFGEYAFIFVGKVLITILPLPHEYKNYKLYVTNVEEKHNEFEENSPKEEE